MLIFAALALGDDAGQEVFDLLGSVATALSAGDVPSFLAAFDRNMPRYQELAANVAALVRQADVTSSIEPQRNTGDDRERIVELDWLLEIRPKQETGPLVRRRETVRCRLEKQKKKWRIVAFEPVALFAPPRIAPA